MKKKKFKRFYALVLSICLVGGILPNIFQPINVKAAEEKQTAELGSLGLSLTGEASPVPLGELVSARTLLTGEASPAPLGELVSARTFLPGEASPEQFVKLIESEKLAQTKPEPAKPIVIEPAKPIVIEPAEPTVTEPAEPTVTEPAFCYIWSVDVAAVTTFGCEVPTIVSAWGDNKSGRTTVTTEPVPGYNFVGWFNYSEGYGVREDEMIYTGESLSKNFSYTFNLKEDMNLVAVYEQL